MQMKIVINVRMHGCDKAKSKAMKIAAEIRGVKSVSIGEENNRLVVIGEGVDSVCLVNLLRKKFCFADIVTIEEVKRSPPPPVPPPPPPRVCYEYRQYDDPPNCSIV